ncbi:MAG TPA: type II toxin-antitoxin system VapC family toxin [Blastocatellia bacterium]|nr:type II toxin-antitoxin system VapC family toxin [Blastocatellia bacterium]HMV84724.1 type II toxin-antitoxin system VapC family toxin [Blastocatellia bacterium]HMX24814.1 type II toxin-antitoxin system VapC family toxin [Blastocatellia bacterium]HMY75227.1 type II toxin-antitoxin system VapC family toxin [Blastocatellia bacterium]HNG30318.1 type II toxin-antitoxin system VapC family toxin [Blastocatellia bacterium]
MNLLLDTHTLQWFALGDAQLSATARQLIEDPANTKFVSPTSYWEIAIKISIGKYILHQPYEIFFDRAIRQNGFLILPIELRHTAALTTLPYHHRDPFDRLLVVQAMVEGQSLVSIDAVLDAYPIQRLW